MQIRPTVIRAAATLCILTGLIACSSRDAEVDLNQSELQIYRSAQNSLASGNYNLAVTKLQGLESRFPFGRYAEQSQLEIIYAYYKSFQPEAARSAADRFIRLHSRHPNVDYAYYLKGMASFEEDRGFLDSFIPIDSSSRDPGSAREAFNDFGELIQRFPDSKYSPDARQRMIYLRNNLARYEVHVARYYITRGAFIAAANRGRYVFEHFQEAPSMPDALAVMVEAYSVLNLEILAGESLEVLATNFPAHESLDKDGEFKITRAMQNARKSWLNIVTFGLLG
jgi:outer membrane protein assembly factor BamD